MASKIDIFSDEPSTTIVIGNTLNARIVVLFFIEVLVALFAVSFFIWLLFADGGPTFGSLILLTFIVLLSIVAYRYLIKITEREIIKIDKELLIVNLKSLLTSSTNTFEVNKISGLSYQGFQKYTDHPLKGESFDYLGFQTVDKQIQTVHEDGNISFVYEGNSYYFGKRLPSWEVEKMCNAIIQATDGYLQLDMRYEELPEQNG